MLKKLQIIIQKGGGNVYFNKDLRCEADLVWTCNMQHMLPKEGENIKVIGFSTEMLTPPPSTEKYAHTIFCYVFIMFIITKGPVQS